MCSLVSNQNEHTMIGSEELTRTEWLVEECGTTEEDAHLLLAFNYFIATRNKGLTGEELEKDMEDFVTMLCCNSEKVTGLLNILKENSK